MSATAKEPIPLSTLSRREFLGGAAAAGAASCFAPLATTGARASARARVEDPVVVSSANGKRAIERVHALLAEGKDPLDAAIEGVVTIEEDPSDTSVGYGGLPNEEGVVELDASVMHGPRCAAGAVASLRNIKTPSRVARLVMERTDHVLLVGEGALRFARAHGFDETNLLTEKARRIWLHWKETLSTKDDWLAPEPDREDDEIHEAVSHQGTVHVSARTATGDLAGVTSTSGLAFKIPGRVGDSPILGAGLFLDNDVGSAGSTGRGEAVIQIAGAHTVVEGMRAGLSPKEACLEALRRIASKTKRRDLLDEKGRPNFQVNFYAVNKAGEYAGAALWKGARFAACDAKGARHEASAWLFEKD